MHEKIIITGDLNMDLLSDKGQLLLSFMKQNNFVNSVPEATRVFESNMSLKGNLIDVVLHNSDLIEQSSVFCFPFSDHKLVLTFCKFEKRVSQLSFVTLRRKLDSKI